MPLRLRLAVAFAAVAAALFALGGWAFATRLSSAQLSTIDSQLTVQLTQAARYLPPGSATGAAAASSPSPPGGQQRAGRRSRDQAAPAGHCSPVLTAKRADVKALI